LSLIVVFVYGGLIWYVTPIDPKISWEGHLAGLLSGLGLAVVFKKQIAKPPKYHWESSDFKDSDDLFMQHFDEEGNFVDNLPFQNMKEEETEYNYIYTEKSDDKN